MPRVLMQRDAEMAALGRHLREVRQGAGRVMVVCGPAGIGKSSLLAAAADASGLRVLRASGSPLEQDAGWGIARQLFAPLQSLWTGPARRALDADFPSTALAGDAMHAAAYGLTQLACGLADRTPTLLVVDDVHWADAPSLRWLVQLSRRLGDRPLGVLGAVRSGDPPASPGLLAELLAAAPQAPVRPGPLGPEAVAALVGHRLPAAGPSFALACHAVTAGNPFLLGALLAHVVAEGIEPTDEVGARLGAFGPEQVARVLDRQLARLPSGAGDLARAFAVLGRAVPLRQAAALAGADPATAPLTADRLGEAGLLRGALDRGTYALVHPLVAAALHEGMAPGERALWHARAAGVLASERADPEVVALHLMRTEPSRDPATVRALRLAAERAARRGAMESAEAFLRRALNEPPGEAGDEAEVRAELGLLLATRAGPEAAGLLAEALDLASDPERRARLALAGGRALGLAGYFDDAFRLCRRGLERPDGVSPVLLGRIEAELIGNAWTRADWLGEARVRLASPEADRATPVGRVNEAWIALYDGRPVEETRALLTGANDDEEDRDSILGTSATIAMIACGDLDGARERCGALIDTARERGWLIALAHGGFLRAMAEVPAGRIDEAAEDARMAYEFKKNSSPPIAMIWSLLPLADVLIEQDELDEAGWVLDQAVTVPGSLTAPMLWERRGRLRLAQHRPAEAHEALVRAADEWRGLGMLHPAMATWRVDDCFALAELGEMKAARRRADEHLESARKVGVKGPIGAGLRAAARVGEPVERLTAAVRLLEGSPFTLELVRALVDLGAARRRAGQRAGAREPLTRALDLAVRGGMRALADRARAELLAAGARPRRTACSGWDALTPAERRVATLAAEGRGNREIAQQLFVTRRTVETHLTHVFQKLGVATRAELTTTRAAR
jgi:DNA-binding CsgD family transcriptional regulator/tetratricopeptide (TPR) repeat protein